MISYFPIGRWLHLLAILSQSGETHIMEENILARFKWAKPSLYLRDGPSSVLQLIIIIFFLNILINYIIVSVLQHVNIYECK